MCQTIQLNLVCARIRSDRECSQTCGTAHLYSLYIILRKDKSASTQVEFLGAFTSTLTLIKMFRLSRPNHMIIILLSNTRDKWEHLTDQNTQGRGTSSQDIPLWGWEED